MRSLIGVGCAALVWSLAAQAQGADLEVQSRTYVCDRGVHLPVTVVTPPAGDPVVVMQVEGKQVALRSQPSDAGARFVAFDEQDSYRFYPEGDTATVGHLYADHTAQEVQVLTGCEIPK